MCIRANNEWDKKKLIVRDDQGGPKVSRNNITANKKIKGARQVTKKKKKTDPEVPIKINKEIKE